MKNIAVVGGGAAGFFSAIHAAGNNNNNVTIFEKGNNVLGKVRISGGGRCNVTHACFDVKELVKFYPRGSKELLGAFHRFNTNHTLDWFESRGVELKTESDGRMFPVSDNSQTIINCLIHEARKANVKVILQTGIGSIKKRSDAFELNFQDGLVKNFDSVIITSGGYPSLKSYQWIKELGINIIPPIPSLFTFNIPSSPFKGLEGLSIEAAEVSIPDSKFGFSGPLLITHWGVSGPCVLKTSAYAARFIAEKNYEFKCHLNFLPHLKPQELLETLLSLKNSRPAQKVFTKAFYELPQRLWERLCEMSGIEDFTQYANLNKKQIQTLSQNLQHCELNVKGKTTFKEEFVTCGGVDLKEIDMKTMQSKKNSGLYFAGEILDIDGVTGGFNFQAAWTTGFIAGSSLT